MCVSGMFPRGVFFFHRKKEASGHKVGLFVCCARKKTPRLAFPFMYLFSTGDLHQVVGWPIKLSTSDRLLLSASFPSAFDDAKSRANKHRTAGRKQTRLPKSKVHSTWGWCPDLWAVCTFPTWLCRCLAVTCSIVVLSGTTTDRQVGCLAVPLCRCDQNSDER